MRNVMIIGGLLLAAYAGWTIYQEENMVTLEEPGREADPRAKALVTAVTNKGGGLTHNQWVAYFRSSNLADQYNNIQPEGQKVLHGLVKQYCVDQFESGACVQHVLSCGQPCVAGFSKDQRARIFEAYQVERKKAGLPMLKIDK